MIELLIVATLFFALLALVSSFMVKGKGLAVRTETLATVQREAQKLVRALATDLGRGTMSVPQWESGALIFLSSKSMNDSEPELEFSDTDGRVVWKSWVAYYLDPDTKTVRRFQTALPTYVTEPADAQLVWTLPDLPTLDQSTGKIMANGIIDFVPTGNPSPDHVLYTVRAEGTVPLGNLSEAEKKIEVEISTVVRLGTVF